MSTLDQSATIGTPESEPLQQGWIAEPQRKPTNVGEDERVVSVLAGAILALQGLSRLSIPGLLIAGVGGALIHRGVTGRCNLYSAMGVDTAHPEGQDIAQRGIRLEEALLIDKPAEELYGYWRDFSNLPKIMSHLERVEVLDERRSRWYAKAPRPRMIGGPAQWEAEIIEDIPNERISWRSTTHSEVENAGEVRFSRAAGDRGTEIHVTMLYIPPAGKLGHWISTLTGNNPERQIREDLRRFKCLMETGEVATTAGQSHGSCSGMAMRYSE